MFVDETGANTAMTRTHGRAPLGERIVGVVPGTESATSVVGMRPLGMVGPMAVTSAMDTPHFESYLEQILVPKLRSGDVVIRDNLKPHSGAAARWLIVGAGARLVRLPPYSPDLEQRPGRLSAS